MRTSRMIMLSAPLAVALMAGPALAHGPGGGACRQELQALCSTQQSVAPGPGGCLQALCPAFTPGPGAFASCITALTNAGKDVSACSQQVAKMQAKRAAWKAACVDSGAVAASCPPDTTGPRAIGKCLRKAQKNDTTGVFSTGGTYAACGALLAQHHWHHRHHHWNGATGPTGN